MGTILLMAGMVLLTILAWYGDAWVGIVIAAVLLMCVALMARRERR